MIGRRVRPCRKVSPLFFDVPLFFLARLCGQGRAIARVGIEDPVTDVFFIGGKRIGKTTPEYERLFSHVGRRTFVVNPLQDGHSRRGDHALDRAQELRGDAALRKNRR